MDAAATYAGSFFISSDSETVQDFFEFLCVLGQYLLFDLVAVKEQAVQIRVCCGNRVIQAIHKQIINGNVKGVCNLNKSIYTRIFVGVFKSIDVFTGQEKEITENEDHHL